MNYQQTYAKLLEEIAKEADAIALRYFRAADLEIERKRDGSRVTQADKEVEAMARTRVAASGLHLDVLGEEMGGDGGNAPATKRPRMIIDPIDGTEEFSRGIPTFGTLMGIEDGGEIVAAMVSAPGLRTRWWAYKGEGAYRDGARLHVSDTPVLAKSMVFSTGTGPSKDSSDQSRIRRYLDGARN
ncbi:MAG TPA: inositol monophosphatase family protein, partial [Candidatus Acidoferrum sp.]|nr:inositol monophosphatase family protein [Candidatus Acidoferrum sp.]